MNQKKIILFSSVFSVVLMLGVVATVIGMGLQPAGADGHTVSSPVVSHADTQEPLTQTPAGPTQTCGVTDGVKLEWMGKPYNKSILIHFEKHPWRIIRPGQAVTMDFSERRVNIHVNDKNVVVDITCG